jgi:hypothetical protein
VIALVLLIAILTGHIARTRRSGYTMAIEYEMVTVLAAATVMVLLFEPRLLTWLAGHGKWERNYGYALFALALASYGAGRAWEARATAGADTPVFNRWALLLAAATACLQLWYANEPGFVYSPLILLALGVVTTAAIAHARQSSTAAASAVALTACACWAYLIAAPMTAPGKSVLMTVLLLTSAILFWVLAQRLRQQFLAWSMALAAWGAVVTGLHAAVRPDGPLYALAVLPIVAGCYHVAHYASGKTGRLWRTPLRGSALVMTVFAIYAAFGIPAKHVFAAETVEIVTVLLGYAAFSAMVAWKDVSALQTGLCIAAFDGAAGYWLVHHPNGMSYNGVAFLFGLTALAWLGIASVVSRLPEPRRAAAGWLCLGAAATSMLAISACILAPGFTTDHYFVYTLLIAGAVIFGTAGMLRSAGWAHTGVAVCLTAYSCYLSGRIGGPAPTNADIHLVPVGLYILVLGMLAKRRCDESAHLYHLCGLLLVLTPTFLAAWRTYPSLPHALFLATECVAAIAMGIGARIKLYVAAGTSFLVSLIVIEGQGALVHGSPVQIHWSIFATILGIAIIGSAIYFETRREHVLRWTKSVQERWKDWD